MATTETRAGLTTENVTIADVDSHVTYDKEDLLRHMLDKYSGMAEMLEFSRNMQSEIYSAVRATPAWFQLRNEGPDDADDELNMHVDIGERTTAEGKLRMMDAHGIDYSILGTGPSRLSSVNHDTMAVAIANAYNSYVLETFVDADDRLKPTISVAPQKPDKAAEEIDRVKHEKDVVGVQLPEIGLIPPAGHPWYDPIYEAAEDAGLPILMHSGNAATWSVFPIQRYWAETFTEDHAFTFPVEPMWHLISMIFRGVPEKFPDLDFVFQESGAEWLGWMRGRLDDHYLMGSQEVPMLTKPPSEYIDDQFYFGTQPVGQRSYRKHTAMLFEIAGGADTVMFSTDHPHPDFDPPKDVLDTLRSNLDEDVVRGIMGGTAMDVFGIE